MSANTWKLSGWGWRNSWRSFRTRGWAEQKSIYLMVVAFWQPLQPSDWKRATTTRQIETYKGAPTCCKQSILANVLWDMLQLDARCPRMHFVVFCKVFWDGCLSKRKYRQLPRSVKKIMSDLSQEHLCELMNKVDGCQTIAAKLESRREQSEQQCRGFLI